MSGTTVKMVVEIPRTPRMILKPMMMIGERRKGKSPNSK